MHRSATSLTTEVLSSYGLYVGSKEDLWEPAKDNQRGFFENKYAVRLNDRILYEHGMHWATLKERVCYMETNYSDEVVEILVNMLENAGENQTLLLKDPRMCLLEPIWKKQLNMLHLEEHIVMVFRHPYEVAKSLQVRDNIDFSYALKMWFFNNYCALRSIAACDTPVLVLNHDNYFTACEKQIKKIEDFLQWTGTNNNLNEIIDPTLRHNDISKIYEEIDSELNRVVFDLYQYLLELSDMKEVVVEEEKLNQMSKYLNKIVSTSYLPNGEDQSPVVFRNCLGREKKVWCAYQLHNNSKLLVDIFQQFQKESGIQKLSIYGNGTLTKALLQILEKAGIHVDTIYDKNPVEDTVFGERQINIVDIKTVEHIDGEILNTVVNYRTQIEDELLGIYTSCSFFDLYDLMYEMLKVTFEEDRYESIIGRRIQ